MAYPEMTVEQFVNWYNSLMMKYRPEDPSWILSTLVNDDVSSDEELVEYFLWEDPSLEEEFIVDLLSNREYFWDFNYVKNLHSY